MDVAESIINPVVGWDPSVVIVEVNEFFVGDSCTVGGEAGE